jgi:hypothetical protein
MTRVAIAAQQSMASCPPLVHREAQHPRSAHHPTTVTTDKVLLGACDLHSHQSVPCLPGIKHFHLIKSIVLHEGEVIHMSLPAFQPAAAATIIASGTGTIL